MTGCVESGLRTLEREIEGTIEVLGRAAEDLLRLTDADETVSVESEDGELRAIIPLRFPDGIGEGVIIAELFRYHDSVRLDVHIEHNRRFVAPRGGASDRRCFFNDFEASITMPPGTTELPSEFRKKVRVGIEVARHGVQRHNRQFAQPWHQVRVVAG
jgi:hypothetical protein